MAVLHIALQEGFTGDEVVIRVEGKEVFHKSNVKTRTQIGFADSVDVAVEPGRASVEILLPARNISVSVPVALSARLYLAVSLRADNTLTCKTSNSAFGYL